MSATDSTGYFIELGENNLIIARTNLSQRPRTVDELREVWLGDNAAVDGLIAELKPAGTTGKAVTLLRLKPRAAILADSALAQKVKTAAAAEDLLKEKLGADYTPASWAWAASKDGRPPENGAQWILDATPLATAEEAIAQGIMFAGNPDTVYRQIMNFYEQVGGFGNLTIIGRSGFMTHAEAEKGIRLFSKEVLPRLREIKPVVVD